MKNKALLLTSGLLLISSNVNALDGPSDSTLTSIMNCMNNWAIISPQGVEENSIKKLLNSVKTQCGIENKFVDQGTGFANPDQVKTTYHSRVSIECKKAAQSAFEQLPGLIKKSRTIKDKTICGVGYSTEEIAKPSATAAPAKSEGSTAGRTATIKLNKVKVEKTNIEKASDKAIRVCQKIRAEDKTLPFSKCIRMPIDIIEHCYVLDPSNARKCMEDRGLLSIAD